MFADDSNKTKVKVCGLTRLDHARFVSGAMADFVGFIFVKESPRAIEPSQAGVIVNWLEGPKCVGVFQDQALDDVNDIITQTGVHLAQLHGNESPEYCQLVKVPVIKTISISEDMAAQDINDVIIKYENIVEYFLFDTKVGSQSGGTGKVFDWSILEDIDTEVPIIIAGGVSKENVRELCASAKPFAIDVNSSLEESPGIKDFDKMETFFEEMEEIWDLQETDSL